MDLPAIAADPPGDARWASGSSSTTARRATARTRGGGQGLPQPARQRLALRRRPGDDRARRSPTAAWASCRRWAPRSATRACRNVAAYVRSLSGLAHDTLQGAARQAAVRAELRRVPRRGRQGQPGHRRAEPDRQIWLYGSSEATISDGINKGRHLDIDRRSHADAVRSRSVLGPAQINLVGRVRLGPVEQAPAASDARCRSGWERSAAAARRAGARAARRRRPSSRSRGDGAPTRR